MKTFSKGFVCGVMCSALLAYGWKDLSFWLFAS